jgi:hypothetical protein
VFPSAHTFAHLNTAAHNAVYATAAPPNLIDSSHVARETAVTASNNVQTCLEDALFTRLYHHHERISVGMYLECRSLALGSNPVVQNALPASATDTPTRTIREDTVVAAKRGAAAHGLPRQLSRDIEGALTRQRLQQNSSDDDPFTAESTQEVPSATSADATETSRRSMSRSVPATVSSTGQDEYAELKWIKSLEEALTPALHVETRKRYPLPTRFDSVADKQGWAIYAMMLGRYRFDLLRAMERRLVFEAYNEWNHMGRPHSTISSAATPSSSIGPALSAPLHRVWHLPCAVQSDSPYSPNYMVMLEEAGTRLKWGTELPLPAYQDALVDGYLREMLAAAREVCTFFFGMLLVKCRG